MFQGWLGGAAWYFPQFTTLGRGSPRCFTVAAAARRLVGLLRDLTNCFSLPGMASSSPHRPHVCKVFGASAGRRFTKNSTTHQKCRPREEVMAHSPNAVRTAEEVKWHSASN